MPGRRLGGSGLRDVRTPRGVQAGHEPVNVPLLDRTPETHPSSFGRTGLSGDDANTLWPVGITILPSATARVTSGTLCDGPSPRRLRRVGTRPRAQVAPRAPFFVHQCRSAR